MGFSDALFSSKSNDPINAITLSPSDQCHCSIALRSLPLFRHPSINACVMMESHSSIGEKGTARVSSAVVTQERETGCFWRSGGNHAGCVTGEKQAGWNGKKKCDWNGGKDGTNGPTANQTVTLDQQCPKQPKRLAPGHHTPTAAEPQRHQNHRFRMRETEKQPWNYGHPQP